MKQEREYGELGQRGEQQLDAGYIVMIEALGVAKGS